MTDTIPKMGLVGDVQGALARELRPHIELTAYRGSLQGLDGVVLDAQTSSAAALSDQAMLSAVLESGKTLAAANPTPALLQALRTATGAGPGGPVALIAYTKVPGLAGPARYHSVLLPASATRTSQRISDSGRTPAATAEVLTPLGPAIVTALKDQGRSAPAALALGDSVYNLIPPVGAIYGYSSFNSPLAFTIGYPEINGKPDDSTVETTNQPVSDGALQEFFVYYVNGESPTSPYYIVILRETGTFGPGSAPANNNNSRGFFQIELQVYPNTATQPQNQPFSSGVTTLTHNPVTGQDQGYGIPLTISVPMTVIANVQGGTGPVPFTAQVQGSTSIPDWGVNDESNMGNNSTSWLYHQMTAWDPTQELPANFGQWWQNVYPSSDNVAQMPPLSWSGLNYETYTAWRFDGSLLSQPRDLSVQFSGGWVHELALLHNPAGCLGAEGSTHHHLFYGTWGWGWSWTFDLGVIAQPTTG